MKKPEHSTELISCIRLYCLRLFKQEQVKKLSVETTPVCLSEMG